MSATVLAFPSSHDGLTKRDLETIRAETPTLPGQWALEVQGCRDTPGSPEELSAYLYLGRRNGGVPFFGISRQRGAIRLALWEPRETPGEHYEDLGAFPTVSAAFAVLSETVRTMAAEWGRVSLPLQSVT